MKKLLCVVDYQQDFVNGALGFAGAERLEPGILKAVEQRLEEGGWVVFTRDTHEEDYLATREGRYLPIPHCVNGSHGHQLYGRLHQYEALPLRPHTAIINKPVFGSLELISEVERLCGGPPDLIELCGLVTDICVIANAILLHTSFPKATIRVLEPLCGSGNSEGAAAALKVLAGLGIEISR